MKLLETADVFVTNLLPDSRQRMGIDVDQVRARNPKIIYARGHGYGIRGDLAAQGGFDLAAYWARGGIGDAYSAGDGSYPPIQRPAFGDSYGGLAIAGGIAAALVKRERTGEPSVVDVSLLNAAIWQLGPDIVGAGVTGQDIPKFNLDEMPNPVASIYKTRDNRFIAFVLLQADRFWADFCTRLGRADLIEDERFADARRGSATVRSALPSCAMPLRPRISRTGRKHSPVSTEYGTSCAPLTRCTAIRR